MESKAIKVRLWFFCLLIVVLFWGSLVRLNYACDTYSTIARGFVDAGTDMLVRNGRIVTAIFYWMLSTFNISADNAYWISFIGGILCATTAVYILTNRLNQYSKLKNLNFLIAVLTIINPICVDYFMYFEIVEFWSGILFAILALENIIYFWEKRKNVHVVVSFIWLTLCVFCYQALPAYFLVLSLPFIIYYSGKKFWSFIKNNILVTLELGGATLLNFILLYCVNSNKLSTVNFKTINWPYIKGSIQVAIWNGYEVLDMVFPTKTAEVFLLILVGSSLVYCLYKSIKKKQICYMMNVAEEAYIILGSVFIEVALMIMGAYGRARMFYPLGAIWGVIMIEVVVNILSGKGEIQEIKNNFSIKALVTICGIICLMMLAGEYLAFQNIIIDRYQTNAKDKLTIEIVQQAIEEHEAEAGEVIKGLVFYEDSEAAWAYDDVEWCQDDQVRAWIRSWSNVASFNYFTGKNYETGEPNMDISNYFSSINWDTFSYNQLIFDGDTLHICVY